MKKNIINILLVCASITSSIFILEITLREINLGGYKQEIIPDGYHIPSDKTFYDIAPNFATSTFYLPEHPFKIWSNNISCFDKKFSNEKSYIYLTGDSFAWGYSPFEDKWGTKLEEILNTRVLKCGVLGFGTAQELIKSSRDISSFPEKPKLIIVSYFANDLKDDFWFMSHSIEEEIIKNDISRWDCSHMYNPTNSRKIRCLLQRKSLFYNFLVTNFSFLPIAEKYKSPIVNFLRPYSSVEGIEADEKTIAFHQSNILKFKSLAEKNNSKLLFIIIPYKKDVEEEKLNYSNDKIKKFLDDSKIDYIDLMPEFKKFEKETGLSLYWNNDQHWNILGNHIAGYLVADYILKNKIIVK